MEYLEQHRGKERVILVSVSVQMLDDLDAEEFNLLAQSADAEILEHIHAQRVKPDAKFFIGSGKAEEIAECVEELDANLEGEGIEIAFNSRYISDVIRNVDEECCTLCMNTNVSPCVICPMDGDSYLYLVLPVRVYN